MTDNLQNTQIGEEDLNLVDQYNGSGSVSAKTELVFNAQGESLKGALKKYNGSFSMFDELQFIHQQKRQLFEYQTERYDYIALPLGLDKYKIEKKVIEDGSVLIVKVVDEYYALKYVIDTTDIYDEPRKVRVNEPKSSLHNKVYDLANGDAIIIRNNQYRSVAFADAYRFIRVMEKTLYQMEKNLHTSAPKGLLNLKNAEIAWEEDGDSPYKDSMEMMINSPNTFFVIRNKSTDEQQLTADNSEPLYIPIEMTDRTDTLIKNYTFYKEQVKEIVGAGMNVLLGKKERVVTDELANQQSFANATFQHAFNIRKIDIEKFNKAFGENVEIVQQSDGRTPTDEDNSTEEA